MICYRDKSYRSDKDKCATLDSECRRRLTKDAAEHATRLGLPISWQSFKETCGKYQAKS